MTVVSYYFDTLFLYIISLSHAQVLSTYVVLFSVFSSVVRELENCELPLLSWVNDKDRI